MANEIQMKQANAVFKTLCDALDNRGWRYEKNSEKLVVQFGVTGDDVPMKIVAFVDADRQLVRVFSKLPFQMKEDKRLDGAIAACVASYGMVDGNFDFNIADGSVTFRMVASYKDSILGEELFLYLIDCTCAMVDQYNDRFLMLNSGIISISDFINKDS